MKPFLTLFLILTIMANRCHFTIDSKIFILKTLQKSDYYQYRTDDYTYYFNFCSPVDLINNSDCNKAYAMQVDNDDNTCTLFASDSMLYYYESALYSSQLGSGVMITQYSGVINNSTSNNRSTQIVVLCGDNSNFNIKDIKTQQDGDVLLIIGQSKYGCPMLQISGIWQALQDNSIIFGLILFFAGIMELLFGRKMINPTLFIACYAISFSIIGVFVSEILLKPNSSFLWIYACLLIVIFTSSIFAYIAIGLTHISIFFIGAWMGLIVAMLVNTVFIKLTGISSVWSLVIFSIILCLGLGLLIFRLYDQIIIFSTSITGAYMIIRPISWIFKGYPNQFLVAQQIQAGEIKSLPGTFFIYLLFMIILAIIGLIYQFIQLRRQRDSAIQMGIIQQKIQNSVDLIRNSVNAIINKYRLSQQQNNNNVEYIEFNEIKRNSYETDKQAKINPVNSKNRVNIQDSLKESININPIQLRFSDFSNEQQKNKMRGVSSKQLNQKRNSDKSDKSDKRPKSKSEQNQKN